MLEKILVPLDGSKLGELPLIYVKELAKEFHSAIHVIYVCEKHDPAYREMVQKYLDKVAGKLQSDLMQTSSRANVEAVMLEGKPSAEIIRYAQEKQVSLILIASHGRTGIMAWVMGSTANKVIHIARQPALLVRASMFNSERPPENVFRKILVPLDGSESGEAALRYISEIAEKLKSEIILLSVVEAGERIHSIGGLDYIQFPEELIDAMKKESEDYLARINEKLTDHGIIVQNVVREGNAAEEIVNFGNENNISLIVMSSYGKSNSREWVLGGVANKVLHVSKLPMFLVKPALNDAQGPTA